MGAIIAFGLMGASLVNAGLALVALRRNNVRLGGGCTVASAVLFICALIIHP